MQDTQREVKTVPQPQQTMMTFGQAMMDAFGLENAEQMREAGYTQLSPAEKTEYKKMLRDAGYNIAE